MSMHKQEIKISVIIPIYNMERYLPECLDSVMAQTLREIEIVCINDGSIDSSSQIIKNYMNRDNRIVLIDQENEGVASARNAGISRASGEYICFMDPDDWYPEDDILQTLYDAAIENNVNICGGSFSEYLPDGRVVTEFTGNKRKYRFENDGLMFYKYYQFDYGYHRFIYYREFLKENDINFPKYIRFQDPPFFVKAMVTARKFYALTKITYAYRVGHQNVQWTEKKLSDLLRGLTDNLNYSNKYRLEELHQTTVRRLAVTYRKMYAEMVPHASAEFISLLAKADRAIDDRLLSADDRKWDYHNIIINILRDAKFNDPGSIRDDDDVRQERKTINCEIPVSRYGTINEKCRQIKVSVIVPIYNVEKYLVECLETILDQTLKEIEIVCVNDGSTDNSREIVKRFAEIDKRVVLVDKPNGGLSSARNTGLKHADGKYIYFIDSDDYLEQNALKELYEEAEKEHLDIIYFNAVPLFESEEGAYHHRYYLTYYIRKNEYDTIMSGEELYSAMEKNGDFRPSACLQFLRKGFLDKTGVKFYEGIIHEDNLFTIQSLIQARLAKHLNRDYYHRRLREGSIMTVRKTTKNVYGYFITLIELIQFLRTVHITEETMNALKVRLKAIEHLTLDIYNQAEDKDMTSYLQGDKEKEILFEALVKEPHDFMLQEHERLNGELHRQIDDFRKQKDDLNRRNMDLQYQLDCARCSVSFRIGRIITCIPRKVRTFLRYWKHYGFKGAMELLKEKLKLG